MSAGTRSARLVEFLLGRAGMCAAAAWGFAEGTLFFLVPDILLTATALFSVRRSLRQMAAVLAGSLAAGTLLYGVAAREPAWAARVVQHVPFVTPRMFAKVDRDYQAAGVWALTQGPMSGVPYKIYAVEAPRHTDFLPFLLVSIPARLERFVVTWAIFAALGALLRRRIQAHPRRALLCHGLYWAAIYAYYWSAV